MNFLICGLGSIGYRHLKILKNIGNFGIWAFRSGKSTISEQRQKESAPDQIFDKLEAAIKARPDAALVTNPTFLHLEVAQKIAERGIPIFIDKPLDCNLEKVFNFQSVVREKKIPVLVGFNLMFHPGILKIFELLKKETIGDIIAANVHWGTYMPEWHPWEDYQNTYAARTEMGGGVVLTMCHELNYLTYFFGKVVELKAMEFCKKKLDISGEEGVNVLLKHETDIVSNVHLNYIQKPNKRTCQIIGENGTIFWDYRSPEVVVENSDSKKVYPLDGDADSLHDKSYENEMSHFIDVVQGRVEPKIPLSKGIQDLELCTNILKEIGR